MLIPSHLQELASRVADLYGIKAEDDHDRVPKTETLRPYIRSLPTTIHNGFVSGTGSSYTMVMPHKFAHTSWEEAQADFCKHGKTLLSIEYDSTTGTTYTWTE